MTFRLRTPCLRQGADQDLILWSSIWLDPHIRIRPGSKQLEQPKCSEITTAFFYWALFMCKTLFYMFCIFSLLFLVTAHWGVNTHYPHSVDKETSTKLSSNLLMGPSVSAGKESACSAGDTGDMGLIPELGRPLEEEMATHSSTLVWKVLWTEEPDGQQSRGSQRVGHDWVTKHTHKTN